MPHCLSAQEHDPAFGEQPEGWHATSLHIHEPIKEPIEAPIKEPAGPHQPLDASATQPTATVEPMTAQTPVEAVSSSASPDETGTTSAPKAKPEAMPDLHGLEDTHESLYHITDRPWGAAEVLSAVVPKGDSPSTSPLTHTPGMAPCRAVPCRAVPCRAVLCRVTPLS